MSGNLFIAAELFNYLKVKHSFTCGNCRLIQDCNIKDMNHPDCDRVEPWEEEKDV
jgi:hypothetical protein